MRPQPKITLLFFVLTLVSSSFPQSVLALDAQGWFEKGNELSQQGRFEEAAEVYQRALQLKPDDPTLHFDLATCCFSSTASRSPSQIRAEVFRI